MALPPERCVACVHFAFWSPSKNLFWWKAKFLAFRVSRGFYRHGATECRRRVKASDHKVEGWDCSGNSRVKGKMGLKTGYKSTDTLATFERSPVSLLWPLTRAEGPSNNLKYFSKSIPKLLEMTLVMREQL